MDMAIGFDDSDDQLSYLKRYVVDQRVEILSLKRKLNYVLKFIAVTQDVDEFDVDENYSPISVADKCCQNKSDRRDASAVNQSDKVVGGGSVVAHSASGTTSTSGSLDVISQRQSVSLKHTSVVAHSASGTTSTSGSPDVISQRQSVSLKHTILSAVYAELSSKGAKNRNVVVSGLLCKDGRSDADIFQAVYAAHLHCHPVIITTRRLGKSQPNQPQLLRVVLASEEQAADVERRVKLLRNSSNENIRSSVK